MNDPFDLERFLKAQHGVFETASAELRRGRKDSHWMWFIFPQLKGLGRSWMAEKYAISSRAEAEAFLAHPVLGPRLLESTRLVNLIEDRTAEDIFGDIDTMKFRSSMTLFSAVSSQTNPFRDALKKFFDANPDAATLNKLAVR